MKITNEKGVDVDDIIGPFDEDATLILVCIVTGGNPTPEVTWWQEERMIDRHAEVRHSEQGVARNVLQLERLGRVDLRTKLSCHASNTQLSQPLTKSVEIELNRESYYKKHFFLLLLRYLLFTLRCDASSR
uniref:Ig-like domain-containing protein n=1 Tax=Daphnia galeata TaxID=27404 RepID=A0A8J2RYD5_9CRUS|nr:unnamed protein product [Daphnia galeata]